MAARPEVTDREGMGRVPLPPSLEALQASGRKMVSDSDSFGEEDSFRRRGGAGADRSSRGILVCLLTSLSFLHSTDLLRAEYFISTPFISSTDGRDGTALANKVPSTPSRPTKMLLQTWQPDCDQYSSLRSCFPRDESGSDFRRRPRIPCDRLQPPRRWVETTGWRHQRFVEGWRLADAPSSNHMRSPMRPTRQLP